MFACESSEHRVVQEVPSHFAQRGIEPSSILISLWIMWPPYSHSWFCCGARNYSTFFCSWIFGIHLPYCLPGSLCSLWGGAVEIKEWRRKLEDRWPYFAILHEDQQPDKTPRSNIFAVAGPLCCSSPTSAAYVHPMHCRRCCYHCPTQDNEEVKGFVWLAILGWKSHIHLTSLDFYTSRPF